MRNKISAFSILELSIVLLIAGLLAIGILKGSNLITASRLTVARSTTSQSIVPKISGLIAWYETSLLDSLKIDEAINDKQITAWYDISPQSIVGKKNPLIQSTGSAKYKASGIAKIPSISFDANSNLALQNFYQGSSAQNTIFIVARPSTLSGVIFDSSAGNGIYAISLTNSAIKLNAGSADLSFNSSQIAKAGDDFIIASYFNRQDSKLYLNNAITPLAPSSTLDPGANNLGGVTIGTNRNASQGFAGLISEIIIYNRSLQIQERKDVMAYLSKKYQISIIQ